MAPPVFKTCSAGYDRLSGVTSGRKLATFLPSRPYQITLEKLRVATQWAVGNPAKLASARVVQLIRNQQVLSRS